jgi:hypothetical protein
MGCQTFADPYGMDLATLCIKGQTAVWGGAPKRALPTAGQCQAGAMFWFSRKRFVGS